MMIMKSCINFITVLYNAMLLFIIFVVAVVFSSVVKQVLTVSLILTPHFTTLVGKE